jgi:hypothetical protein
LEFLQFLRTNQPVPRRPSVAPDHPELGLPEVRKLWQTEELFSYHCLKVRIQHNEWWPGKAGVGVLQGALRMALCCLREEQ